MSGADSNVPPQALPDSGGYAGLAGFHQLADLFVQLDGLIRTISDGRFHAALVQVKGVSGGGPSGPPTVDVQPMVNQVDGLGKPTPHGTIHGLPVFRLQAGASAIILDPIVGDIGLAVICDRDISNVKSTKKISNPGSFRSASWSDGCYLGSFLGGAANTYIQVVGGNVNIAATGPVALTSPTLTHNGINVGSTHVHPDAQGGLTGPPQ